MSWVPAAALAEELGGVAPPDCAGAAAIAGGRVLDVPVYLRGLWLACGVRGARWRRHGAGSVAELLEQQSPGGGGGGGGGCGGGGGGGGDLGFDCVIVTAGAGVRHLPETRAALCDAGVVGFSRGQSVEVSVGPGGSFSRVQSVDVSGGAGPPGASGAGLLPAAALLCGDYVVPVGDRVVLGATHEHVDWRAFDTASPAASEGGGSPARAAASAAAGSLGNPLEAPPSSVQEVLAQGLGASAAALWPPLAAALAGGGASAGAQWPNAGAARATAGVRVTPRRTHLGKLPVAGRVYDAGVSSKRGPNGASPVWALTGLGSRGLIYHALLADALARAVITGDDCAIPSEVRL